SSFKVQFARQLGCEARLIHLTCIRALLYLDHVQLLYHFETVSAGDEKYDVSAAEHPTFAVLPLLGIEVHAHLAFAYEKSFLCVKNLTPHWIMSVCRDHLAGGIGQLRQLLGIVVPRKELDAGLIVSCGKQNGTQLPVDHNFFRHSLNPLRLYCHDTGASAFASDARTLTISDAFRSNPAS